MNTPNILYFPTKLDGSQPRKKRKDKVFFYPDTGVIGEQGGEITHINNLTKLPIDKYFYNFNTFKKTKTPISIITRINNLVFISQTVFSKYFNRKRKIYKIDYSTLHTKVKYEKRTGNHHLYITLDDGAGYQRIVLDSRYRKLKDQTRMFKLPDYPLKLTLSNSMSLHDHCTLFALEGFEDAVCLQSIIDNKIEPFYTHLLLPQILTTGFYKIFCTFGSATLHNHSGAIIIPDNDIDFQERKGYTYLKIPKQFKDLNSWISHFVYDVTPCLLVK